MTLLARMAPYLIVLAVVGMTHLWAYHRGANYSATKYELQLQELRVFAATEQARLEHQAREVERAAEEALSIQSMLYQEESRHAQREIDSLRADLRASRLRLSVPVTSCTAAGEAGDDPAVTGGPSAEARAELVPEVAAELVSIAADGDAAVRQSNRLIDAYNALREQYNALVSEGQ
jgi:TolA-binding protein